MRVEGPGIGWFSFLFSCATIVIINVHFQLSSSAAAQKFPSFLQLKILEESVVQVFCVYWEKSGKKALVRKFNFKFINVYKAVNHTYTPPTFSKGYSRQSRVRALNTCHRHFTAIYEERYLDSSFLQNFELCFLFNQHHQP